MMKLWYIRGPKAGTFEDVSDEEGKQFVEDDVAQECGSDPLRYPENHPHYGKDVPPKKKPFARKKVAAKKKYPNKMMETE